MCGQHLVLKACKVPLKTRLIIRFDCQSIKRVKLELIENIINFKTEDKYQSIVRYEEHE